MNLESTLQALEALVPDNPYLRTLVLVAVALVAAKATEFVITRVIARWTRFTKTDFDDRLIALLHRPVFVSVLLVGLWLAVRDLPIAPGFLTFILRAFKTIAVLVWLGFALRAASLVIEFLAAAERKLPLVEARTVSLLSNTTRLVLFGGALYALFLSWGIDVGGLLLSAGVVGLALGLAAKDTLAHLFSGLFILVDAPYKVGDFINLDTGERGQVTQIGLRSTRLLTRDDIEVTIPNGVIANAKVVNETGGPHELERLRVKVGVAYGSDVDRVREILLAVAGEHPLVCKEPEPRVRFRSFGDSALEFDLLVWVAEPVLRGRVLDALNTAIYKRFAAEGVEIPYPKRDVYLRRLPAADGG